MRRDNREFLFFAQVANTDAKIVYFQSSEACLSLHLLVYYLQKREFLNSLLLTT